MRQRTEQLAEIETVTLGHYNQNAEVFWDGTKDHDVTQNYAAFLAPFPKEKKLDILDFGCGPGRDVILRAVRFAENKSVRIAQFYPPFRHDKA